ncbi:MAG: TonB-dependent receptor [Gammaproteobacteria bacterium]|nr:TonB-dependent receptor [Gammaproteobacteria bacterium]
MKAITNRFASIALLPALSLLLPSSLSYAEQGMMEEIVTLGTRGDKPRSVTDSPVPVDVIGADDFLAIGGAADITDNLNTLVPSYTATPATGDDSAMVRPTSLRGMAADQTLVLVNGKRRHRSAVVQLFAPAANNGSHAPDVGQIPSIALKNVEILRDGAAAQYGSDAIAGVINFALKDASEGGIVEATYGQHFEGEMSWKIAANTGVALGEVGFLNLSLDSNDNEGLSRGNQRPDAQALIDGGTQGVGADAVFDDEPFVQSWGRPETKATRFVFNSGINLGDTMELYSFGNYSKSEGRFRFFYRDPANSDLAEADAAGATNLDRELNAGYTPYLDGEQDDYSFAIGLRGDIGEATTYDASVNIGHNELDYTLFNSLNGDAPLINGTNAQRDFDTGDFEQDEINLHVDLSTPIRDDLVLSYGAEWREETFTIIAGESASYVGGGVSGRPGNRPDDAGEIDRDNWAVYGDLEHEISEDWLMQYALRYEDFSDFGDTVNGKVASRYTLNDITTLRGAISTGFHAPTPGQSNIRNTITTFTGAPPVQQDTKLLPPTDPEAVALGGAPLKEEESVGISFGVTTSFGQASTLTADIYHVEVDDRIYRTANLPSADPDVKISFFTNALDVQHQGLDVVLTSEIGWSDTLYTDISFAFNYNEVKVEGNKLINGVQVVGDDLVEDIENNYPKRKFTLTGNTPVNDQWNLMTRVRYIGEHYDERGNIAGTSADGTSAEIDPIFYVDVEVNFDLNENFRFTAGAANLFDEYPEEIRNTPGVANRNSVGLPYPRRSAANYEGGSWYLKSSYSF